MRETDLEKRGPAPIREKAQYAVAFSVIAALLYGVGFPVFVLFFFGVLSFFIWKVFSAESRHETRKIFEFYLAANEILRDDDRRWYGFEIHEAIRRGDEILRSVKGSPPLVYFALGALYQKVDDHSSAVKNLAYVLENSSSDESMLVHPSKELREYVRLLRKIERSPAESPLTSSSVRSLERMRKNKGRDMLAYSRTQTGADETRETPRSLDMRSVVDVPEDGPNDEANDRADEESAAGEYGQRREPTRVINAGYLEQGEQSPSSPMVDRKSISEVLHDIYDKNIQ